MRREHAGNEKAGCKIVTQKIIANRKPEEQRNAESEESKDEALVFISLKFVQIEFQTGNEHDVKESDRRKKFDCRVLFEQVNSVGPNDYSG
jgi:hypothetical protein